MSDPKVAKACSELSPTGQRRIVYHDQIIYNHDLASDLNLTPGEAANQTVAYHKINKLFNYQNRPALRPFSARNLAKSADRKKTVQFV